MGVGFENQLRHELCVNGVLRRRFEQTGEASAYDGLEDGDEGVWALCVDGGAQCHLVCATEPLVVLALMCMGGLGRACLFDESDDCEAMLDGCVEVCASYVGIVVVRELFMRSGDPRFGGRGAGEVVDGEVLGAGGGEEVDRDLPLIRGEGAPGESVDGMCLSAGIAI